MSTCSDERWAPSPRHPEWYEVSSCGRVRSWRNNRWGRAKAPRILKPGRDDLGRLHVSLQDASVRIHSLVAGAFLGPRPTGAEACHGDGNPSNNHATNLRYDTHEANGRDMVRHGTSPRGERNGVVVLDELRVLAIARACVMGLETQREIAERFGVSPHNHQRHRHRAQLGLAHQVDSRGCVTER